MQLLPCPEQGNLELHSFFHMKFSQWFRESCNRERGFRDAHVFKLFLVGHRKGDRVEQEALQFPSNKHIVGRKESDLTSRVRNFSHDYFTV
jgi:hypothetical protein